MRIVTVVGARPQFIKAAAVARAMREHNAARPERPIREILVHTGQHYDDNMSQVFFDELGIPPAAYNLGVGSLPHGVQTGRMLERIEGVLLKERPDWVLVYGDTNSTLAGALAAGKLGIPVAHVEAGLRSHNRRMPEELNRVVTDHVASLLLCPTHAAVQNLQSEGIVDGVELVGDVMYDCALYYASAAKAREAGVLAKHGLSARSYYLASVHRAGNTDDRQRLEAIVRALNHLASKGCPVVFPLHPRTRQRMRSFDLAFSGGVKALPPVAYLEMLVLETNARAIVTDSGGVQKEAYFHGVPCVTLRAETEWVETVQSGWNTLVAEVTAEAIVDGLSRVLAQVSAGDHCRDAYGSGFASDQIVRILGGKADA